MTIQPEPFQFHVSPGAFETIEMEFNDSPGSYLLDIQVHQQRTALDDIGAYIVDHDNLLIWRTLKQTTRVGPSTVAAPDFTFLASSKLHWGTLSFRPPEPGRYYLVLDNTHSSRTAKSVTVVVNWFSPESQSRKAVRKGLAELNWTATWRLFEQAEESLMEKRFAGACLYTRTAVATLWKQVAENNSGRTVTFDPGKSTDIGQLLKMTDSNVPSYVLSAVKQSWSLASELTHSEKRGGEEPPPDQVILALRYAYAAAAFLVTLARHQSQSLRDPRTFHKQNIRS